MVDPGLVLDGMVLDHIAIAVKSVEFAAENLCALLGYTRKTRAVTNTRQQTTVLFLKRRGSIDIKLIEPSNDKSPLMDFVAKGGGVHHFAFRVKSVVDATARAKQMGARVISPPAPGEAFEETLISFCYAGYGFQIEYIETDLRRALLPELTPAASANEATDGADGATPAADTDARTGVSSPLR